MNIVNSSDQEEPMTVDVLCELVDQEIMETSVQMEITKEDLQNNQDKSVKKALKRKRQKKMKFTHKKRCTRPPATCKFFWH